MDVLLRLLEDVNCADLQMTLNARTHCKLVQNFVRFSTALRQNVQVDTAGC